MDILNLIVGADRAENRVEQSGAVSGRCRKMMERSAEREVAGMECRAGVTEIGCMSVERLFRPLRSAHMLRQAAAINKTRYQNITTYKTTRRHYLTLGLFLVHVFN